MKTDAPATCSDCRHHVLALNGSYACHCGLKMRGSHDGAFCDRMVRETLDARGCAGFEEAESSTDAEG